MITADGDIFILGIELPHSVTIHAVLYSEDQRTGRSYQQSSGTNDVLNLHLINIEYHIGDNPDYKMNAKCTGGPWM